MQEIYHDGKTGFIYDDADELYNDLYEGWYAVQGNEHIGEHIDKAYEAGEVSATIRIRYGEYHARCAHVLSIAVAWYKDNERQSFYPLFDDNGLFGYPIAETTGTEVMADALEALADVICSQLVDEGYVDESCNIDYTLNNDRRSLDISICWNAMNGDSDTYVFCDDTGTHEVYLSIDNPDPYKFCVSMYNADETDTSIEWEDGTPITLIAGGYAMRYAAYGNVHAFGDPDNLTNFLEDNHIARTINGLDAHTGAGRVPYIIFYDEWINTLSA